MTPAQRKKSSSFEREAAHIAAERFGWKEPEGFKSRASEAGIEHEQFSTDAYAFTCGVEVEQVSFVRCHEYVGCSPDGLVGDDGLVEIKTPELPQFLIDAKYRSISSWKYKGQVFGNLWVTGRKWCDWVSYHKGFEPIIVRVNSTDLEYIKWRQAWEPMLESFLATVEDLIGNTGVDADAMRANFTQ